jgi:Do/DeqQ family serine protease
VESADDVRVETTDGRTMAAKIVGVDPASDLALIKIEASDLHPVALGDSNDVEVGDVVLAIGNPLGIGQTVTMGIISAKGRSTSAGGGAVHYEDFLQTDAPINHGNSGGALVNMKGELIGINSQILSESGGNIGIGFAIPSNMARHVMDDLRTKGRVTRAQLGVTVQGVTSEMAESLGLKDVNGVIIGSVMAGSAAERAGLKRGDIIRAFNGQPVRDTNALRNRVADVTPGSTVEVTIVRDGGEERVRVDLDEARIDAVAKQGDPSESGEMRGLGVAVAPTTPELAARYGLSKELDGLVVEEVRPDGRGADAGLQAGDVIVEANRHAVASVDELRTAVQKAKDHPLLLLVERQGRSFFMTVRPDHG